jgi:hypothetical protein
MHVGTFLPTLAPGEYLLAAPSTELPENVASALGVFVGRTTQSVVFDQGSDFACQLS